MLSISRLILVVSVLVALAMVAATYFLFTGFGDRMLRQSAAEHSQSLARVTFSAMYQLMNQGWKREQVEAFADGIGKSVRGMPMQVEFHRGELVGKQYGPIGQGEPDIRVAEAMRTGRAWDNANEEGVRHLMPMQAKAECLSCHDNAKAGDVLGVIEVRTGYQQVMGETRLHLMLVLLLLAPLPVAGAFLVAAVLDGRMHGFIRQLDEAIDKAPAGATPDFDGVEVKFSELRELLSHYKRLVKRA